MTGRHLFDLQREVSLWPSRHVVLRIYCLALGAKRTSASWVTRPDLRCVFGQSGSRAPWGVRTYFGSPYWAELVRNLPPTSISKFGSKGTPPPLGYFGTLAQYRRPPGGPAKTDGRGMPPDDSWSPLVSVWDARYPGSPMSQKRLQSHRTGS
jgi:hypothetical protein